MSQPQIKTVFITGASSGIGRASALYFQDRGWQVVATMRNPDQAGELAALPGVARIDRIHCAGPLMKALHAALPHARRGEWHATAQDLAARAGRLLDAGDVALVKGSKGSRAALVVDAILKLGQAVPASSAEDEDA